MYSISIFYFTFYLFWGCAYAPTRTPLLTGLLICPTVHSQLFTLLLHSSTRTQKPFIAKFHYTGPTGRTRPHKVRALCRRQAKFHYTSPTGPARTFLRPWARFTKYLTTILRLFYDNAKVTIDLRRTSNLQNILRRAQGFS